MLGHSQMRPTVDTQRHVIPALGRQAADRLSSLLLPGEGGKLQPEATQAALPTENGLVMRVELRGLEPLPPTLPGRHDRVRARPPASMTAL